VVVRQKHKAKVKPRSHTAKSTFSFCRHLCATLAGRSKERPTEGEIARRKLGPRGVPGAPDTATMTPQYEKILPKEGEFDGHAA
jgi:hypothetical protein